MEKRWKQNALGVWYILLKAFLKSVSQNFTRIFRKKSSRWAHFYWAIVSTATYGKTMHVIAFSKYVRRMFTKIDFTYIFSNILYEEKNILAISTNLLQLVPHIIEWPCPFPIIRIHVMDEYDKQSASVECQNGSHIKNGSRVSLFVDGLQFRPIVWSHMKMQWT